MNYTKTIVCLANSRKISGRCIAGKEKTEQGFGGWIRPISNRPAGEISEDERMYQNGDDPQVLDLIEIPLFEYRPHYYQTENHLLDDRYCWKKVGQVKRDELHSLIDLVEGNLWVNGYSSYKGTNDRIPEEIANKLDNSLVLIQPEQLSILVDTEGGEFGNAKRKVRAKFILNNKQYKLAITDPRIERAFLKKKDGQYPLLAQNIYMCLSIGEPYNGFCYKLAASLITSV